LGASAIGGDQLAFGRTEEQYRRFIAHVQTALRLHEGAKVNKH
jgi:hypothetical protein